MVQVLSKNSSYLIIGKYRFNMGYTEVPDEDFYELMKSPTFAYRIKQGILSVPKGFPLEKPEAPKEDLEVKKAKDVKESAKEAPKKSLETDSKDSDSNKNKK